MPRRGVESKTRRRGKGHYPIESVSDPLASPPNLSCVVLGLEPGMTTAGGARVVIKSRRPRPGRGRRAFQFKGRFSGPGCS
ncbi:protein of unknown function [Shinella sp. WSC3-e]|nr:hypothetical protein SHINE37_43100 [Rhizobiaceae bacterium]CAK7257657.1 protein of unknown function [Shinella sp. WSC3-e]